MQRLPAVLGIMVAVLSGCLPETRVTWSPDGRYALIRSADGLYLCDGDGKLSPRIAENVAAAAWTPDSRAFLAACVKPLSTWDELLGHLSDARKQTAQSEASAFRQEILAYKGDWQKFSLSAPSADIRAALLCLRDQYGAEFAPVIGEPWSGLKALRHAAFRVQRFDVADGQAGPGKVLLESLEPIAEIRVAPTGKAFAYAAPPYPALGAEAAFSLHVASFAAPDKVCRVADRVSIFFDWTPDGGSVVFAQADTPDPQACGRRAALTSSERALVYARDHMPETYRQTAARLGRIVRAALLKADGTVLESPENTTLAWVPFFDSMPARCLRDGRVLFAAAGVQLPATEMPKGLSLFTVGLESPRKVEQVLTPEARNQVGERLHLMQLSPDETQVSIPGDALTVLNLATGQVTRVCQDPGAILTTIPVWRSNRELCFAVSHGSKLGSPDSDEIVLWSPADSRCLSKDWPRSVAGGLLPARAKPSTGAPAPTSPAPPAK